MPATSDLSVGVFGQLAQGGQGLGPLLLWLGVLIVVVVVCSLVLVRVRKGLIGDGGDDSGAGWSLHSLRELHSQGKLSDAEFERAKEAILGSMAPALGVDLTGDPLPRRPEGGAEASAGSDDDPKSESGV